MDLKRFHGRGVREERLDNLSEPAAARLLYQADARYADAAEIVPDKAPDDQELLKKAAAGKSPPANPATTSGPTNSGRDWDNVAAALQNVRCVPPSS